MTSAAPAVATTRLACSARMSTASPTQYSTVHVYVRTASVANVRTAAYYRTTTTVHTARTNSTGYADVPYRISRATKGYKVVVRVNVSKGTAAGSCATYFIPR